MRCLIILCVVALTNIHELITVFSIQISYIFLLNFQYLGEMSMEELVKKYEGAYGSDFEMAEEETAAATSDDDTEEYDDASDNGLCIYISIDT